MCVEIEFFWRTCNRHFFSCLYNDFCGRNRRGLGGDLRGKTYPPTSASACWGDEAAPATSAANEAAAAPRAAAARPGAAATTSYAGRSRSKCAGGRSRWHAALARPERPHRQLAYAAAGVQETGPSAEEHTSDGDRACVCARYHPTLTRGGFRGCERGATTGERVLERQGRRPRPRPFPCGEGARGLAQAGRE